MASGERIGIVGAGIIGCAIAFELSRRGAAVTVMDGRSLAGGATQASAGILAPYTEAQDHGALFDLAVRGLAAYDGFVDSVRAVSTSPFEYARSGTIEIADTPERERDLRTRAAAAWAPSAGLHWLDADGLRAFVPGIRMDAVGALLCQTHGHVAVPPFVAAIADAAQRLGTTFEFGRPVDAIDSSASGARIFSSGESREFDRVVLCAGSWTSRIAGADERVRRIAPVRGQLVRLHAPSTRIPSVLWGGQCYLVPWADGTLLVGATSEHVGFDERATVGGVRGLLDAAQDLVPELASATYVDVRVGLRPATADGVPLLGPGPDPRIILAAGHFRNGILLAPLTAIMIADFVMAGTADHAFSTT